MKTDLVKRVERMESKIVQGIGAVAVFTRAVYPGHIDRPVAGWRFGDGDGRVEVLRHEGETDEELRRRAVALFRAHSPEGVPVFSSIN